MNLIKSINEAISFNWQFKGVVNNITKDMFDEQVIEFAHNLDQITSKVNWNKNHVIVTYLIPMNEISKGVVEFITCNGLSGLVANIYDNNNEILFSLSGKITELKDWYINLQSSIKDKIELVVSYDISYTKVF